MPYSSDFIVATGTCVEIAPIELSKFAPEPYVLTIRTAGTQGDRSVELAADKAMDIRDGQRLDFADGSYAVVAMDRTVSDDVFSIGTENTIVPVQPLAGAISQDTIAVTKFRDQSFEVLAVSDLPYVFAYRLCLGVTDGAATPTVESVDTTNFKSGYGASTTMVGNVLTTTVSMNRALRDRSYREVIDPVIHDTSGHRINQLVWMKLTESDGTVYEGPCRVTPSGKANANRQAMTGTIEFKVEGNSYSYIPSELALFNIT